MTKTWCLSLLLLGGIVGLFGCPESRHIPGDGDGDGDADGDADGDGLETIFEYQQADNEKLDLLFVIDNSSSTAEQQAVLADQAVILLRELTDPPASIFPAIDDIHVGVVSTDMGSGGYRVMTCENPEAGDDGVLQNRGRLEWCDEVFSADACDREECPWLDHQGDEPDGSLPLWDEFACIATLGTSGCGFEQPLEASYRALVEQTRPGRPNEGFLRPDSLLAIIYVTEEDDCSSANPELYNPSRDDFGPINPRCVLNEDQLHPISRYHDAFVELRGGDESRVFVSAIAGIPVDGSWNPGDPIERLRELQQINPSNPNELLPSCDTAMGKAFPPVRLAELVYSFGNNGILASICQADWTSVLQTITRRLPIRISGYCFPPDFDFAALSGCRVVEELADDRPCPNPADDSSRDRTEGWHRDLGVRDGRRLCEVLRADYDSDGCPDGASSCSGPPFADGLEGWYIDPRSEACEEREFMLTSEGMIEGGSTLRLQCPIEE